MNMSNYLAAALLNRIFRGQAMTFPTNVYVALYTSDPTKNDTGQEVTGGGYARQQVIFSAPVAENGKQVIRNSADVVFTIATDEDRKSTRLNSSHVKISYAGFCSKKRT